MFPGAAQRAQGCLIIDRLSHTVLTCLFLKHIGALLPVCFVFCSMSVCLQNHPTRQDIFDFMFVQLSPVQSNSFYLPL